MIPAEDRAVDGLQHGTTEKDESFAIIRIIALLTTRQSELIETFTFPWPVAVIIIGLVDEKDGYFRPWQRCLPEVCRHHSVTDRDGQPVRRRRERNATHPHRMVERQEDRAFVAAPRQRGRQRTQNVRQPAGFGEPDNFRRRQYDALLHYPRSHDDGGWWSANPRGIRSRPPCLAARTEVRKQFRASLHSWQSSQSAHLRLMREEL